MAGNQDQPSADRGSDQLMERLGSHGHTFSVEELRQVLGAFRKHNGKVLDWCQYGQPGIDGVCGKFIVRPGSVGPLVTDLMANPKLAGWRVGVFPLGKPALDQVMVDIRGGMSGGIIIHG